MRFKSTDEFGNNWSPFSYIKESSDYCPTCPNVIRKEKVFSNFDFTLMSRIEIKFLRDLALGKNPYPKTATNRYGSGGWSKENWEYKQLSDPEMLKNALNWAPLNEELNQNINDQVDQYNEFYNTFLQLNRNTKYGKQRPDFFLLSGKDEKYVMQNLDKFIKAGTDVDLPQNNPLYGRIIPTRELVYYIRKKYGISSSPTQTQEGGGFTRGTKLSEFKLYYNQFLFTMNPITGTGAPESQIYAINRISNQGINRTLSGGPQQYPIRSLAGKTLSEQHFLTRAEQYNLYKNQTPYRTNSELKVAADTLLNETYNSINTQRLFAHYRSLLLVDEVNNWSRALEKGVESGHIIPVLAEVTKNADESKILSQDDRIYIDNKLSATIKASKNKNYNQKVKIIQYISNVPDNAKDRNDIPDNKYHVRPWNKRGGANGNPIFKSPEYSSDFLKDICDRNSKYFMRNLIRPDIESIINPAYFTEPGYDNDETSLYLTLVEFEGRFLKELPILNRNLSNRDYLAIKYAQINIPAFGINLQKAIIDSSVEMEIREELQQYFKNIGVQFPIYQFKSAIAAPVFALIVGLGLAHEAFHAMQHSFEHVHGTFFSLAQAVGAETWARNKNVQNALGKLSNGIHYFEYFLEPIFVGIKILSALAQISIYNDFASYTALVKEAGLGFLALEQVFRETNVRLSQVVLGRVLGTAGANIVWVGIIIGTSLYIDSVVTNIRQKSKQEKFEKLLDEAHKLKYIEGVYAETGGDIRITKKDFSDAQLSENPNNSSIRVNSSDYNDQYITSNRELMGAKGKKLFWDRIASNPIDCKTLLQIAGKASAVPGELILRHNPILNKAPNQQDVGFFTSELKYSIDGDKTVLMPGSYNRTSVDQYRPFVNVPLSIKYKVTPRFKYTRKSSTINRNTDLTPFLGGNHQSSEFKITEVVSRPTARGPNVVIRNTTPILQNFQPTDKEKVFLIRKKYGLDLINTRAGRNCCDVFTPINASDVSKSIVAMGFPSNNEGIFNEKFFTGERITLPTGGVLPSQTQWKVGCEYLVDLADPVVINKLKEICQTPKKIPAQDKQRNKKNGKKITTSKNKPLHTYNNEMNEQVINAIQVNYITQMGNTNQQIYQEKGGNESTAGVYDITPSTHQIPRFGKKADVENFALSQGPVATTAVSKWLVGFVEMDIHADLRNFINTLATAFATSHDGNPVPSDKIDMASLNTPIGGSNYFQWTPYGIIPTEIESSRTMDSGFGTQNQGPPRTRG